VIAAVADAGYTAVTVADIVQGARVSRSVFDAHFADKEDCFLSATREGARLMSGRMASATRVVPRDASDEQLLRAGFLAFLEFLADEQAFARVLHVDLPTAGPMAAERLAEASHLFANLNRKWHRRARTRRPDGEPVGVIAQVTTAMRHVQAFTVGFKRIDRPIFGYPRILSALARMTRMSQRGRTDY
jgi:AcrR family transcriptional regulator